MFRISGFLRSLSVSGWGLVLGVSFSLQFLYFYLHYDWIWHMKRKKEYFRLFLLEKSPLRDNTFSGGLEIAFPRKLRVFHLQICYLIRLLSTHYVIGFTFPLRQLRMREWAIAKVIRICLLCMSEQLRWFVRLVYCNAMQWTSRIFLALLWMYREVGGVRRAKYLRR